MPVTLDQVKMQVRPSPPGDIEVNEHTLRQLNLPENIIQNKAVMHAFLLSQYTKLSDIEHRPEIKSVSGDIPEMEAEGRDFSLATDESDAVGNWLDGARAGEAEPGSGSNADALVEEIRRLEQEISARGGQNMGGAGAGGSYLIDSIMAGEIGFQSQQEQEKWKTFIQEIIKKGDPIAVILAVAYKVNDQYRQQMGSQLSMLWSREKDRQDIANRFNMNYGGEMKASDMVKFQNEQQGMFMDVQMITHQIQDSTQKRDTFNNMTTSLLSDYHQAQRSIIEKFKAT